jgi:hypothetical protein
MMSVHRSVLWPAALLASSGCFPDSVSPGDYGAADEAGAATATDTAVAGPPDATPGVSPDDDAGASAEGDRPDVPVTVSTTIGCDLTGRWLATDREVSEGLGAQEANHMWFYLELSQTGSQVTVTRGLDCGEEVRSISAVGANVDYPKLWPSLLSKDPQTGRKATSTATSSGCSVTFEKRYMVFGATVPFYDDASEALPTASQQGSSSSPGWEDWDQDGNPGVTFNVTGLAVGQLYLSSRKYNAWSGTIATGANTFKLADTWDGEQSLLGYDGPSLLSAASMNTRDNDDSLHFVDFARLDASQATGDDATTCAAVRKLAPTLTPDASN